MGSLLLYECWRRSTWIYSMWLLPDATCWNPLLHSLKTICKMRAGDARVINGCIVLIHPWFHHLDFSARCSVRSLNTLNSGNNLEDRRRPIQHAVRVVEGVLHLHMLLHPRFHGSVTDTEVYLRQTQSASLCCLCQPDKHSSQSPFRSGLAHRLQRETSECVGCFRLLPPVGLSVCCFMLVRERSACLSERVWREQLCCKKRLSAGSELFIGS